MMRHHFGWEDFSATEAIISNGDWRQDFNGSQYYLDEDDGYERFHDWPRNKYKRAHSYGGKKVEYDLKPTDGWNVYDRGWENCELIEQELKESWDGKMCTSTQNFSSSQLIHPLPSTHVLTLSVYEEQQEQEQEQNQRKERVKTILHWQKINTEREQIDELIEFIRDLLISHTTETQPSPIISLVKKLEKLDRRRNGTIKRHAFESALDSFHLLDLLSVHEMEELFDRYATSNYEEIKYRAFARSLLKKRRKKKKKKKSNDSEESNNRNINKNNRKTLIQGFWREEPYKARVIVSSNKRDDETMYESDEYNFDGTYNHVDFRKNS